MSVKKKTVKTALDEGLLYRVIQNDCRGFNN